MFLGHFGVGFGAKRFALKASLGTMILAGQLLDLVWPVLLLVGVEHVAIRPGLMAASDLDFYFYPYSHSLAAAFLWSLLLGLAYYAVKRDFPTALVVGLTVVSHWFLDLIVHRPDLPLWFQGGPYFGWGGWNSLPLTLVLEFGLFGLGFCIYLRSTAAKDRGGRYGVWVIATLLVIAYLASQFGPPPPNQQTIGLAGLLIWLPMVLGYWVDRHRSII
jgi:hypothetical protein